MSVELESHKSNWSKLALSIFEEGGRYHYLRDDTFDKGSEEVEILSSALKVNYSNAKEDSKLFKHLLEQCFVQLVDGSLKHIFGMLAEASIERVPMSEVPEGQLVFGVPYGQRTSEYYESDHPIARATIRYEGVPFICSEDFIRVVDAEVVLLDDHTATDSIVVKLDVHYVFNLEGLRVVEGL
jgi:hypothetical protein